MNDRLLSFLGLCRRAGYMICGADPVVKAMKERKALLTLTASDLSDNSREKVTRAADQYSALLRELPRTKEELSFAVGKHCGVICVTDRGFAEKIFTYLE